MHFNSNLSKTENLSQKFDTLHGKNYNVNKCNKKFDYVSYSNLYNSEKICN